MTLKKISTVVLLFFPVFIFGKSFSLRTEVSYSNLSIEDSTPNRRLFNGVQVGLSGFYTPQSNRSESLAPVIGLGVNYEFLVANSIFNDDKINLGSPILKNKACINAIYGSFLAGFSLRANMRFAFEILGSFDYAFFARANYTNSSALSSFDTLPTADPKLKNVLTSTTLDKAYSLAVSTF